MTEPKKRTKTQKRVYPTPTKNEIEKTVELLKENRKLNQKFSSQLFIQILNELMTPDAETGIFPTLSAVLNKPDMPTRVSFYRWLDMDKSGELRKAYSAVCAANYDNMHDERLRVAYDISDDVSAHIDDEGKAHAKWNWLNIQRAQVIIRTLEWSLGKLAPAQYGDNIQINIDTDASPEVLELFAQMGEENRKRSQEAALLHSEKMKALQQEQGD